MLRVKSMEIVYVNLIYALGVEDSVYRKRLGDGIVNVVRPQIRYAGPEVDTAFLILHFDGFRTPRDDGKIGVCAMERTVLFDDKG